MFSLLDLLHFLTKFNRNHNFEQLKKYSNVEDGNSTIGEFLKLYLQNSFEENLKIIL